MLFGKRNIPTFAQLKDGVDWHSHLLPGVDDGVKTLGETLAVLQRYDDAGVKDVWFTPHIMEDIPNTTQRLKEVFGTVEEVFKGNAKLHLAAEYMLDGLFDERLNSNDLLPLGNAGEPRLLVETSCFHRPLGLAETIENIKIKGYTPVLAHPERYIYMSRDDYRALKDAGVLFQLNLLSASGHYGKDAKEKASWLRKNGLDDLIGTDLHSCRTLERIRI